MIEAMRGTWRMTQGHSLALFGFNLLIWLVGAGGILACGVGVLITFPLSQLVVAAAFVRAMNLPTPLDHGGDPYGDPDDDTDRPRSRKRARDDEDEDYDERPRRRPSRRRPEEDY